MSAKNPTPWFEIAGFDGKKLRLYKYKGYWDYKLLPNELKECVALELAARVKEGDWGILGIAYFVSVSEKVLKLEKIGL